MKIYISADMEGITGVTSRDEVTKGDPAYLSAQKQMTDEVHAACEGAITSGAKEIWIKDAHWTGRNLDPAQLTNSLEISIKLIRGWSGHPFSMVQELDSSFNALAFVGYHAAAGRGGNPLSHTLSSRLLAEVSINDRVASECLIFSYAASSVGVPVIFLSGDAAICEEARALIETIRTVPTFQGLGASIVSSSAQDTLRLIRREMEIAVSSPQKYILPLPKHFKVLLTFRDHVEAYRRSFYPGAKLVKDSQVLFETQDYFEVLRLLKFMTLST